MPHLFTSLWRVVVLSSFASTASAQLDSIVPPPELPSLPDAPFFASALFENPIPAVIAAIALAAIAIEAGRRSGRARAGLLGGGGFAALGLGVIVLATVVRTERELLRAETRELVRAVAEVDSAALSSMLEENASLYTGGTMTARDRSEIVALVERYLGGAYAVTAHRVGDLQAEIRANHITARTRATVRVDPASEGRPSQFVCMMTWRKAGDRWRVTEIEPLWLQGYGRISARDIAN